MDEVGEDVGQLARMRAALDEAGEEIAGLKFRLAEAEKDVDELGETVVELHGEVMALRVLAWRGWTGVEAYREAFAFLAHVWETT